jgi:hypothetical protein
VRVPKAIKERKTVEVVLEDLGSDGEIFVGDVSSLMNIFKSFIAKYPEYVLKIEAEGYYDYTTFSLMGYRDETDAEVKERVDSYVEQKTKEKMKQEKIEKKLLKELLEKYGD